MTKHENAANEIIRILSDAGDVGFAASCRDEIEEALEAAFPEPKPPTPRSSSTPPSTALSFTPSPTKPTTRPTP